MPHQNNLLLARVNPADMNVIRQELAVLPLTHGQVLAHSQEQVKSAYFPTQWDSLFCG